MIFTTIIVLATKNVKMMSLKTRVVKITIMILTTRIVKNTLITTT